MAAHALDNGEFWIHSEFLINDDILMGKESVNKNGLNYTFGPNFGFPTNFPYDFGSYSLVESVVGSTEMKSDDEGLFTELAHFTLQERAQKMAFTPCYHFIEYSFLNIRPLFFKLKSLSFTHTHTQNG
ncbi:hypothetical protein CsSME_00001909 [Camellia sinensis var. sinensis]